MRPLHPPDASPLARRRLLRLLGGGWRARLGVAATLLLATASLPARARADLGTTHTRLAAHPIVTRGVARDVLHLPRLAAPLGVTVTVMSDTNLTLDSNKPATSGPNTMYVQFRVTNNSGTTLKGLLATLGGMNANVSLAGGQLASQYLTTLAPGASADVYFFLSYVRTIGVSTTLTLTVSDPVTGNTATNSTRVTTTQMQSTGTGGTLNSQVLTATNLGMITYIDVGYIFAGIKAPGTFNMQPAGTTSLDASCFQLVGSAVQSSNVPDIPVGATNRMYFTAVLGMNGSGFNVTMRYYFRVQCLGVSSTVKPYANETSGNSLKYSSNFDSWVGSGGGLDFPPVSNPITSTKAVTPDSLTDGGTATYTVTLTNTVATGAATVDSIVDVLPTGTKFDSLASTSQITAANSSAIPAANATGRVVFRSVPGTYYTVPAGGTLTLVYKVTIPTPEGTYTNAASSYVALTNAGNMSASLVVRRKADLSLLKSGPDSARMRDTVAYVIRTTNLGPSAADTLRVVDTLPAALTFVRASRGATASGKVVSWPYYLKLAKDSTLADTVWVAVRDTGTVTNLAAGSSHALDQVLANSNGSAAASRKTTTLRKELISITVTPDGLPSPVKQLPGTRYAQTFTVTNTGKYANDFDLLLALRQQVTPFLVRDSLRTPAGAVAAVDSVRLALPAGVAQTLTIYYTVAMGDSTQGNLLLRGRAALDTTASDTGWAPVRRVRPKLTLAKSASASAVIPGADVTYTIRLANDGEYAATNAEVEDDIPSAIQFRMGSIATTLPAGITGTVSYSNDGGATWSYVPVSGGCGAPALYDGCVTRLRLTLDTTLPAGTAASTGTLRFTARVR